MLHPGLHVECADVTMVSKGTSGWAEQAGKGSRGQKEDGRQSTPTDDIAITLPREEANSCPRAYLMLWLREQQGQARGPLHEHL